MSLLHHYTYPKSDIVHIPQHYPPETDADQAMIVDTSAIVDITVEELSTVVNLPPGEDPFILYLEEYLRSLLFIVEKIESIKASEKSLRKRIKDGIKLLNSLKGISTPTEDTAQPTEQASTSSPAVTVETAAVIEGISNLADFK